MRERYLVFVLLVTLVVAALPLLAAPAPEVRAQVTLTITMSDSLSFSPNTFTAAPGESVSLTIINAGNLQHTFTLFDQVDAQVPVNDNANLQAYYNANSKIVDINFVGGAQDSASFTAPMTEGTYTIVCIVPGHAPGGMHGTMQVTSTPGEGPAPIDPLFLGIIIAVVVIIIGVAAVFVLRGRR